MEQNEIIEGNKLIAEFMGYEIRELDWYFVPEGTSTNHYWYDTKLEVHGFKEAWLCPIDRLQYYNSWDWLMPVVDKIERIKFKGDDDRTDLVYNYAFLRTFSFDPQHGYLVRFNRFGLHESTSRIEAMWNAVVECIKSFNSDKNDEPSVALGDASSNQS